MNVFYEPLPVSIEVGGSSYPIITDFREWIRFQDMLNAEIPATDKMQFIKEMFLCKVPTIKDADDLMRVMQAMTAFLSLKEIQIPNKGTGGSKKNNLSYEYDAPYIISAFLNEYGIDLLEIDYLHWWKFKMLFDGLSEQSHIKERIYYRDCDLGDIKSKQEKRRIARIKRAIELPESGCTDGDIGNAF